MPIHPGVWPDLKSARKPYIGNEDVYEPMSDPLARHDSIEPGANFKRLDLERSFLTPKSYYGSIPTWGPSD